VIEIMVVLTSGVARGVGEAQVDQAAGNFFDRHTGPLGFLFDPGRRRGVQRRNGN
jgi:hypothetical protein